ncbi:MAG: YdeI/OmpD-associated family protein [Crocinitomicaceae bacterium]|nr:YdeI/OmpD-associated family protein [Crocinitomicaceae bacterium]
MINEVSNFLNNADKWQSEMELLCSICNECGLTEDFKWMHPCYTHNGKNIVIVQGFKDYCALLFNKGALLNDESKLLVPMTENTQASRQIRFKSLEDIEKQRAIIKAYIFEAVEVEKLGLKVEFKKTSDFEIPEELTIKFDDDISFKEAFEALTPGRQKGYLLHFSQAKQSKTRSDRIEKSKERIFLGKGLNDCVCGQSKHYPRCDGSHKYLKD